MGINNQKARVNVLERTPEISARLYYPPVPRPPAQAKPQETKPIDVSPKRQEIELKPDATKATEALDSKVSRRIHCRRPLYQKTQIGAQAR